MNALQSKIQALQQYSAPTTSHEDLLSFWKHSIDSFNEKPLGAVKTLVQDNLFQMNTYKVSYLGFDNTPINGWFLVPSFPKQEKFPCVISFHGYLGQKGYPEEYAHWILMGFAVFAIDIRGQMGETGNGLNQTFGMSAGWITQGILEKEHSYYLAITVDCLRAIDWVLEQPEVDNSRIGLYGGSHGGGLALICSALSSNAAVTVAHVPNMCHMDFGIMASTGSLSELGPFISAYPDRLNDILTNLSYFDNLNLVHLIQKPILLSVSLKDTICLPETIFATYNRIGTDVKTLLIDPFLGHAVSRYNNREGLLFLRKYLIGNN